ncbi:ASCH domain-containing protein [Solirhodobacter olei]|uniref:ASCH domain-containing protein n=1 Tax=Solirhodobacter olei TaxID=2493082 RepID=UPI000FD909EE|nr:ASCH domain-containing protein [Solirhodobacter olei]
MADDVQTLPVVARLFPEILSGEKTSTIRWREEVIRPGALRFVCEGASGRVADVMVMRCTDMPLSEAAAFVGRAADWPDPVMLDGMREHYPEITLADIVQVVEFRLADRA